MPVVSPSGTPASTAAEDSAFVGAQLDATAAELFARLTAVPAARSQVRERMIEAGLPVTRPSERKPSSRKKVRTQ